MQDTERLNCAVKQTNVIMARLNYVAVFIKIGTTNCHNPM